MAAIDRSLAPCCTARRLLAVTVAMLAVTAAALRAQVPGTAPTYFTNKPAITIPFGQEGLNRVRQINLFVSADQGQNWQWHASAQPGDRVFPKYVAPGDGVYHFAVQSIDLQNQPTPATLGQLVTQVKVVVDSRPPSVLLRPSMAARPGQVGVEWDIRDDYLDLRRFLLDYRVDSVTDWIRETSVQPAATGSQFWEGLTSGQKMTVRLRVADKANNEAIETTSISVGNDGRPIDAPLGQGGSATGAPANRAEPYYINSRTFNIPYSIPKIGPSGLSAFDLWYTKNGGQTWDKAPKTESSSPGTLPANPGETVPQQQGKMTFTADGEGQFGFLFVVRNGVGIGDSDPRPGDQPRIRVEVDTVPPSVQLRARAGRGLDVRNVVIQWSAEDKNLSDRPVLLQYAESKNGAVPADGDWKPLPALPEAQPKAGAYTWTIGKEGPFKFFIRAKAEDKAGNVGIDPKTFDERNAIVVDLEVPQITIHGVEPATGAPKPPS